MPQRAYTHKGTKGTKDIEHKGKNGLKDKKNESYIKYYLLVPKCKRHSFFSPDRRGNPFGFFGQKIGTNSWISS
jgi:hypothetical protein